MFDSRNQLREGYQSYSQRLGTRALNSMSPEQKQALALEVQSQALRGSPVQNKVLYQKLLKELK